MRRQRHSPEQIAHALAQLEVNGGAVRKTARELGVDHATLASWRGAMAVSNQEREKWSECIRELWEHYLEINLRAGIAQAEVASDPEWLRQQDAHGLAILHGVMSDKARLLTEAARRAGMDQPKERPEVE